MRCYTIPRLILDEPTTGLDPNQLTEIRNVIKM
jgi:ABC-type multidrug transport system ATPase subunit